MTEEAKIIPSCPECLHYLEPQGNISRDEHKYGATVQGKVSCTNCDFEGVVSIHVVEGEMEGSQ